METDITTTNYIPYSDILSIDIIDNPRQSQIIIYLKDGRKFATKGIITTGKEGFHSTFNIIN